MRVEGSCVGSADLVERNKLELNPCKVRGPFVRKPSPGTTPHSGRTLPGKAALLGTGHSWVGLEAAEGGPSRLTPT